MNPARPNTVPTGWFFIVSLIALVAIGYAIGLRQRIHWLETAAPPAFSKLVNATPAKKLSGGWIDYDFSGVEFSIESPMVLERKEIDYSGPIGNYISFYFRFEGQSSHASIAVTGFRYRLNEPVPISDIRNSLGQQYEEYPEYAGMQFETRQTKVGETEVAVGEAAANAAGRAVEVHLISFFKSGFLVQIDIIGSPQPTQVIADRMLQSLRL